MAVFAGSQIQKLQNWQTESGGIIGYIVSAQLKCKRLHTLPFECLFTAHPAWQEHFIVNFFYKQAVWITCSFIFNSNNLVFGYNKCRLCQHSDARKSVILLILFSWSFFFSPPDQGRNRMLIHLSAGQVLSPSSAVIRTRLLLQPAFSEAHCKYPGKSQQPLHTSSQCRETACINLA